MAADKTTASASTTWYLIKDNHIDYAGSLAEAVRRARSVHFGLEIEVEACTLDDVRVGARSAPASGSCSTT